MVMRSIRHTQVNLPVFIICVTEWAETNRTNVSFCCSKSVNVSKGSTVNNVVEDMSSLEWNHYFSLGLVKGLRDAVQ